MKYLIGNWKMNLGPTEAIELARQTDAAASRSRKTIIGIAPTLLAIAAALAIPGRKVLVGAQNAYFEKSGAFTGEVSAAMLKGSGADFVIIGHSERRHKFFESQELITRRAVGVLENGLKLVYCVGETESERTAGRTLTVLEEQLKPLLPLIKPAQAADFIIAYEPVWAIGTGKVASLSDIVAAHDYIIGYCQKSGLKNIAVLYGGSVTPENYGEIVKLPQVSGALVGGASLKIDSFAKLLSISEESV